MSDAEVAQWLVAKIKRDGRLSHATAVETIRNRFGSEFLYINSNGNTAISGSVLRRFRKANGGTIAWNKRRRYWYRKEQDGQDIEGERVW